MRIFRMSIDEQRIGNKDEVQLNAYNLLIHSNTTTNDGQDTRKISFSQLTKEVLPRLDNYCESLHAKRRPSLSKLHGEDVEEDPESVTEEITPDGSQSKGIKLGWIQGVLIPCLLNIWGVMLFLRLAWVVAQAGIGLSLLIILLSYLVCVLTTLSLSAICTNGEVKGGGVYFLISRSLGPEFGASIGLVFAFANTVAASMNTIGFCDSLNELLGSYGLKIIDGAENDTRIIGTIALVIMIVVCAVGMDWESKAQNLLIAIILVAIFNFLIGTAIGPRDDISQAQGFVGFHAQVFRENFVPDFRFSEGRYHNFFSVFAIFFPSVTGLQAGANICGDLKNPATAIPKGTLLALLTSAASYVSFVFFAGSAGLRQASGNVSDLVDGSGVGMDPECLIDNPTYSHINHVFQSCEYGLHNSYTIMHLMSAWAPLIFAGTWAATLSTALTNLLSVPRLIQALGRDRIYPGLIFFSKGYGRHGEPYRGYALTLLISTSFLLIGKFESVLEASAYKIVYFFSIANLNVVAPLITTFYLASYALINFCTFHGAFVRPLGWRPTFKYYNVWLSLIGFGMCVVIMFLINWIASLVTCAVIFALYLVVIYRKPDVNWGSSRTAQMYRTALMTSYRLKSSSDHVKNYRPQVLVLAGEPETRPALVDFANLITKHKSLLIVGNVIHEKKMPHHTRMNEIENGNKWLKMRKIRAFYSVVNSSNFESGVVAMIQASGIGKLCPNIVLMGYKYSWQSCSTEELSSFYQTIHNAFTNRMAMAILCMPSGTNCSRTNLNDSPPPSLSKQTNGPTLESQSQFAFSNPLFIVEEEESISANSTGSDVTRNSYDDYFNTGRTNAVIDVWWLYDDGGLTMLIPYILSLRSQWKNCKIRVFALGNQNKTEHQEDERKYVATFTSVQLTFPFSSNYSMASLLTKLRIPYSSVTIINDINNQPKQQTIDFHKNLLTPFRDRVSSKWFVSDTELLMQQTRTNRQLRLRELLSEHSNESSLVVMSLPMPRENDVSAPIYMSWLDVLTKDMPPFLLIRGNQSSVLTFYS
ncbi:Bumetanide-sensitive sodium-(potassium)-chloride cotransporter [Pseudolycoriella hygida]|uniref:Bumetanide-sensitive sodium-(Potassium)-chloride cotransporter n=1 Tax=Pseudolycoriella hygida TaxID=35572 RepID=A0A9Q0S348_9DIPT|nr:Bumetanide-sensitive sodium-(potassium)-chloride cotransporter [Pseudolycoriella hygida]